MSILPTSYCYPFTSTNLLTSSGHPLEPWTHERAAKTEGPQRAQQKRMSSGQQFAKTVYALHLAFIMLNEVPSIGRVWRRELWWNYLLNSGPTSLQMLGFLGHLLW
jgi:hypothetical protein